MDASTAKLHTLAVDPETLSGIDFNLADANLHGRGVSEPPVPFNDDLQTIEIRIRRRPEPGILQRNATGSRDVPDWPCRYWQLAFAGHCTGDVQKASTNGRVE